MNLKYCLVARQLGTDEVIDAAVIAVTMGCGDAGPMVPGRRKLDWPVANPGGASIETVRAIRDAIDTHLTDLLAGTDAKRGSVPVATIAATGVSS